MQLTEQQRIRSGAAALGTVLSDAGATKIAQLLDELERWNRAYNLTSIRVREEMVVRHVLDSLSVGSLLHGEHIADIGTGAGFPGLPLAIADARRKFTLVDSNQKKIRFITHVVRELGLENVIPLHARVESLTAERLGATTLVARAFAPLGRLLADVRPLAAPDTRVIAMKARMAPAELSGIPADWQIELQTLAVPGLDEARCAVIARLKP